MKSRISRLLSIYIIVVLLMHMAVVPNVFADSDTVIRVSSEEAMLGEEVTVAVSIENNCGIPGFELWLDYDKTMLTPVSIALNDELGGRFDSNLLQNGIDVNELDMISAVWSTANGQKYDGDLYYVTFKIKDCAKKRIPITIIQKNKADVFDNDFNNVNPVLESGTITVTNAESEIYNVAVMESIGGKVYTEQDTAEYGSSVSGRYICDEGYELSKLYYCLKASDEQILISTSEGNFIIDNVTDDISIYAEFIYTDKSGLAEKIENAKEYLTNDKYTAESIESLRTAVENAKTIYENSSASKEDIEQAIQLINAAVENMEVKTFYILFEKNDNIILSQAGYKTVPYGETVTYKISAKAGYEITEVLVNGEKENLTDNTLIFENVTSNKVISIKTSVKKYTVDIVAAANGRITVNKTEFRYGENCNISIEPDDGYIVQNLIVDGNKVGAYTEYIIENISSNHSISAEFVKKVSTKTVTATAGEGGSISPVKSIVNIGGTAIFSVVPDYGYSVSKILVNGEEKELRNNMLILNNITVDTSVEAVFEKNVYSVKITAEEGGNAVINYGGVSADTASVLYDDNAEIVITPDNDYELKTLYVNGKPVKASKKGNGEISYSARIKENTEVRIKFTKKIASAYRDKVKSNGLPSDVTATNAAEKLKIFKALADDYEKLDAKEKNVCSNSYATVLAVIDRASAYILLEKSNIPDIIKKLPDAEKLTADNIAKYEQTILDTNVKYNQLTVLAKSLLDYNAQNKLYMLLLKADDIKLASDAGTKYVKDLIETLPDEIASENLISVYIQLKKAENIYNSLTDSEKAGIGTEITDIMNDKLMTAMNKLCEVYINPFTELVNNTAVITADDSVENAEEKKAAIHYIMSEYDSFAECVQNIIPADTIVKMNELYTSANVMTEREFEGNSIQARGDIDTDTELVIKETEKSIDSIADSGQKIYTAMDISIKNGDDKVQPNSKIQLRVSVNNDIADKNPKVMYVDNNGDIYDIQAYITEQDNRKYITWSTDHFSCFAIVYSGEAENDEISFDKTEIKAGEEITAAVGSSVNTENCDFWLAGYDLNDEITFVKKSTAANVKAEITDGTVKIKAMLWEKDTYRPIKFAEI